MPDHSGSAGKKLTIVDVVETLVRVVGVIHHEGAPEAIAVLSGEMAVIPVGTCATVMRILYVAT